MKEKKSKDYSIIINDKETFIEKEVFDLIYLISQERDYYKNMFEIQKYYKPKNKSTELPN